MSKTFTFLLCLVLALQSYAQNQAKHMEFRGIPITGNVKEFVGKLEQKGYKLYQYMDKNAIMIGQFVNKDAKLFILATPQTGIACKVAVLFDNASSSWLSLRSDYLSLKNSYKLKYGDNYEDFEYFVQPYYEGDGYELQALKREKCHYETYFKTPLGIITVAMNKQCKVEIIYEDSTNARLMLIENEQKVQDDI